MMRSTNPRKLLKALNCIALCLPLFGAVQAGDSSPEFLMEEGHWKQARAIIEPLATTNRDDAETVYLRSRLSLAFKDFDTALKLAEKAVALDDKNSKYHWQLGRVCGEMTGLDTIGFFKRLGLSRRFKSENQRAIALNPKFIQPRFLLIGFHLQAPGIAGGDKNEARKLANEIVRIDSVEGFIAQAEIAEEEKNIAEAESLYLKAVATGPRSYHAQVALANFYLTDALKKYDLVEKYSREAQALDPGRPEAYSALAQAYALQSRWADLEDVLAKAEKNDSDDLDPYYQAGKALLLQGGDMARAERFFRKYLRQEAEGERPDLASAHWRLGLVLEKQGRKQEAAAEVEKALQIKPNFEQAKKDLKRLK
jgi:tetratricopeptide (TPR) repeat protein